MDWTALSEGDVRTILRNRIHRYDKPRVLQADLARKVGVSDQMMSMVLHGKKKPTARILRWLGLEKFVRYRRVK